MNAVLHIDTSDMNTARVSLDIDGVSHEKTGNSRVLKAQMVLPLITELCRERDMNMSDISAISVSTGPGSYTGLRVGCAVANALGFALGIPVNGKQDIVIPVYS